MLCSFEDYRPNSYYKYELAKHLTFVAVTGQNLWLLLHLILQWIQQCRDYYPNFKGEKVEVRR